MSECYPGAPADPAKRQAYFDARNKGICAGVPKPSTGTFGKPPQKGEKS